MNVKSVALVLGYTIHVYGVNPVLLLGNRQWLAHELVHVKQFERYGFIRFLWLYMWQSVKHGYFMNRYEVEARGPVNHMDSMDIFDEFDFEIR